MTNEPSTATSSKQTVLQLLAVERARLDELQRRAPSLTAHELRERLDACRHQIEDIKSATGMSHPDDTLVVMTVAEIGDQVGRTRQAVHVILHKAQRKVAAALLERLGPAVVDLVRNEPLRHNDPRTTR